MTGGINYLRNVVILCDSINFKRCDAEYFASIVVTYTRMDKLFTRRSTNASGRVNTDLVRSGKRGSDWCKVFCIASLEFDAIVEYDDVLGRTILQRNCRWTSERISCVIYTTGGRVLILILCWRSCWLVWSTFYDRRIQVGVV